MLLYVLTILIILQLNFMNNKHSTMLTIGIYIMVKLEEKENNKYCRI